MNSDHIAIATVFSKTWKLLKENVLLLLLYLITVSIAVKLLPNGFSIHNSVLKHIYPWVNYLFMFLGVLLTYVIIYDLYYHKLNIQDIFKKPKNSLKYINFIWDKFVITLPMFVFYIIVSKCFSALSSWLFSLSQIYSFPFHLGFFLIFVPFNFAMYIAIFLMAFHQRSFVNNIYFSYRLIFCRRYFFHSFVYVLVSAIPSFLISAPLIYLSNSGYALYFSYFSFSLLFTIINFSIYLIYMVIIVIFSECIMQRNEL